MPPHKCVGPLTCITFLGIEMDTVALEPQLPGEKLEKLRQLIVDWQGRKYIECFRGHTNGFCELTVVTET